jgi:cyclohexa-1,5-dienecarbonyl-CoA hydratase
MTAGERCRTRRGVDGTLLELTLSEPRGNVVDSEMIAEFCAILGAAPWSQIHAIVLTGAGDRFSYGASIEEHLPERIGPFLRRFHGWLRAWLSIDRPSIAAIHGPCLGGGLEMALACTRLIAHPAATFGFPEIRLGGFAPVGSLLLPLRIGSARAMDLLLSGRTIDAAEALRLGLVDALDEAPLEAARRHVEETWRPLSLTALAHACRAATIVLRDTVARHLAEVERLYLEELMATADATEGVRAFLEKRAPVFRGLDRIP